MPPEPTANQPSYTPTVLWTGGPSLWHFFWRILFGIILLPVFGFGILLLISVAIRRASVLYVVASNKVSLSAGLFVKSSRELRVADIRSINITRHGVGGLFGIGSVEFSSAASDAASVTFSGISSAERIADLVRAIQDGHSPAAMQTAPRKSLAASIGLILLSVLALLLLAVFGLFVFGVQDAAKARRAAGASGTTPTPSYQTPGPGPGAATPSPSALPPTTPALRRAEPVAPVDLSPTPTAQPTTSSATVNSATPTPKPSSTHHRKPHP